jgi:hypothetical protein
MELSKLPGISVELAEALQADGITTRESLLAIGKEGLAVYNVPEVRAEAILKAVADFAPALPATNTKTK